MALYSDLFGNGGEDTLKNVLSQAEGINVPSAASMQIQLQQLVSAGVLTPEQAQTVLQQGNALNGVSASNQGLSAEEQALASLGNEVNSGGSDAEEQAALNNSLNAVNASTKGANDAVLQNQAARGSLTGGETLAAQLSNNATGAATANTNALNARALAENNKMQALQSLGTLGGNVQGQVYGAQANTANAQNAINQFNSQQSNAMNQFNTANKNNAAAENLANAQQISNTNVGNENANRTRNSDLIQQNFNNQLAKQGTVNQAAGSLAGTQNANTSANAALTGGLIGAGATAFSPYAGAALSGVNKSATPQPKEDTSSYYAMGGPVKDFRSGGSVPGHASVPGDSPKNDTVPARLSPGEVVLPRSVVNSGDPNSVHSFLSRVASPAQHPLTKPSVHPKDIASVMSALTHLREGGTH